MTINSISGHIAGSGMMPPPREFTEDQKAQVASILAKYDASSLTAEDAKDINTAFKDAGFRPGAGLRQAIEEAGYDAGTISTLDPPPAESTNQI